MDLLRSFIGPKCFKYLLVERNFLDVSCLKLLLSKCLSLGIVLLSSVIKVPQIMKIVRAKSVVGLSLAAFALELFGYTISVAYNLVKGYPFGTYGEIVFLTIQDVFILLLMFAYGKRKAVSLFVATVYCVFAYQLFIPDFQRQYLPALHSLTLPIIMVSRLPQIVANFRAKSTGQLSAVTVVAYFAGAMARVFTTIQEVNDKSILTSFLVSTVLNFILVVQLWIYRRSAMAPSPQRQKQQ